MKSTLTLSRSAGVAIAAASLGITLNAASAAAPAISEGGRPKCSLRIGHNWVTRINNCAFASDPGRGGMSETLTRLKDLRESDEYDADFLAPSPAAQLAAESVVAGADMPELGGLAPASPAPVGDGGIFVQWGEGDRYVCLIVPSDPAKAYIYFANGASHRTIRRVTAETLSQALRELAA